MFLIGNQSYRCSMHLVAVSDPQKYADTVDYWRDVYGFKMSCMKRPSIKEASVEIVPAAAVVSASPALIHDIDMEKCEVEDTQFESEFELRMRETCEVTAIAGYFDTIFDLADKNRVEFTTGPHGKPTHWKQTGIIPLIAQQNLHLFPTCWQFSTWRKSFLSKRRTY